MTKIELDHFSVSNGSIFSLNNGGIAIPAGTYIIAASLYVKVNTLANRSIAKGVYIRNNAGTELVGVQDWSHYIAIEGGTAIAPKIVTFTNSDILYLYGRSLNVAGTAYILLLEQHILQL